VNLDAIALRAYQAADEEAAIALWQRSWQRAYPHIDFSARLGWWRERWKNELVPACAIVLAEVERGVPQVRLAEVPLAETGPAGAGGAAVDRTAEAAADRTAEIAGFVTVDPTTGYLDQIVVAPEAWGSPVAAALIGAAKRIAPRGIDLHVNRDNARAIRFYEKHGFAISGEDANPRSGAPLYKMSWREM
jgi:putative acetyltransferase